MRVGKESGKLLMNLIVCLNRGQGELYYDLYCY